MTIHRRVLVLVGLGMLVLMTITVFSFQDIRASFFPAAGAERRAPLEPQQSRETEQSDREHAARTDANAEQLRQAGIRISILFLTTLAAATISLLAFGVYFHRKVSAPLSELRKGTEEISRGNLDYRIQVKGARDIALLGGHFNEMARKLKQSYTELEHKLLDRTQELAAFYAEMKESNEKYRDLFENSRDVLFTLDTEGRLTAANRAAEHFSGYAKADLVGKSVLDFLTPEGSQIVRKMLAGEGGPTQNVELEILKRDGSRAFIEVSARRLLRNQAPAGFQVSARDVTEQKALRERLLKAERLGAMGQLGAAVRHEINNPLSTIIGNLELLIERHEGRDKDLVTRLEVILNNALRIAEIVKRVQEIKQDKVVEYVDGTTMTDLTQGSLKSEKKRTE